MGFFWLKFCSRKMWILSFFKDSLRFHFDLSFLNLKPKPKIQTKNPNKYNYFCVCNNCWCNMIRRIPLKSILTQQISIQIYF